ncbi:MAG: hypothetical protein GY702_12575, partial [Desulfobulbaceae bacterium]|nr:hypothetical protein [Desulfobulbaceae bacterium]
MNRHSIRNILLFTIFLLLTGCAAMVTDSFMRPTLSNLQRQTDIDLVCEGSPTLLLMLDSMLASAPGDKQLLLTATQSFSGYAKVLEECGNPERAIVVSNKARIYGLSLLWDHKDLDSITTLPLTELEHLLKNTPRSKVDRLFWAGNGWFSWIYRQQGSPESMAQLVRVERIMLRVIELDETYHHGAAHLFLGAYYGAKPKLFGGDPEKSRHHFEKALSI